MEQRRVFEAAESGSFESINGIISNQTESLDQYLTPHNRDTILHVAIRFENKGFAEKALERCPELLTKPNSGGETPLHTAAKNRSPEMVKVLLSRASRIGDVEGQDTMTLSTMVRARTAVKQDTPLHVGVRYGNLEVTRLLVGVDLEQLKLLNVDSESPLFLAVEGRFFDIARLFAECCFSSKCTPPACGGSNGMNALHAAVIRTHDAWILEQQVPDLSLENFRRLMRSFVLHIEECFEWFNLKNETGIIESLLEGREDSQKTRLLEEQDNKIKWTPLHFAAYLGHVEAAKLILRQECHSAAYRKDEEGMSPLHIAAKAGHVEVMKEIISKKPDSCDLVDDRGWSMLHVAVAHSKVKAVRYILETRKLEFLLNQADRDGNTALHLAVGRSNRWIMKILVDDVRVDKRATNGQYLKPVDVLRANPNIGELIRSWFMKKLEKQGGKESLQSIAQRVERSNRIITDKKSSSPSPSPSPNDNESSENDDRLPFDDPPQSPQVKTADKATKSRRLKQISNTHLLVATLIATVTFTAAFTIPGGYASDKDLQGMATLSKKPFFAVFVVADSVAFYCSTASVLLQFFSSVEYNYHLLLRFTRMAAALTYFSIFGLVVAFASGLRVVMADSSRLADCTLIMGAVSVFLFIIGCL